MEIAQLLAKLSNHGLPLAGKTMTSRQIPTEIKNMQTHLQLPTRRLTTLLIPALLIGFGLGLTDPATAQDPGWSPVIIPTGAYRDQIKSMPIEQRPYRPLHFYGNSVRRSYYRGTPNTQFAERQAEMAQPSRSNVPMQTQYPQPYSLQPSPPQAYPAQSYPAQSYPVQPSPSNSRVTYPTQSAPLQSVPLQPVPAPVVGPSW
jgi:hypothetical protein